MWCLLGICAAFSCREQAISLAGDRTISVDSFDFSDWTTDATAECSAGVTQCILIAFVDTTSTPYVRYSGSCYDPTNAAFQMKGVDCSTSDVMFASDGAYAYKCCDTDV